MYFDISLLALVMTEFANGRSRYNENFVFSRLYTPSCGLTKEEMIVPLVVMGEDNG